MRTETANSAVLDGRAAIKPPPATVDPRRWLALSVIALAS